jgi:Uma2 family endonuclease
MTTTLTNPTPTARSPKYANFAEWLHEELGDVPLRRIVMDPWMGMATEADLLRLAERDKRLCELIEGTLVEKPVGLYESLLAAWLVTYLNNFVGPRRLGIVSGEAGMMRLFPGRVRIPDVAFVSIERLPGRTAPREPIPTLSPDLAVEVLSESNTVAEIQIKLRDYFSSGTRLAWIIDPRKRTVAVYESSDQPIRTLTEKDSFDGGDVLQGFTLSVAQLFASVI